MDVIDLAAFVATAESCDGLVAAFRYGVSTHGRWARFYLQYGVGGHIERHRKDEGGGYSLHFRTRSATTVGIDEAEAMLYGWAKDAGALPTAKP